MQPHRYPRDQAVPRIRLITPKRQKPNTASSCPALTRVTGACSCRRGTNSGRVINAEDNSIAYAIALEILP
jgi:hypothetical protein